MTVEILPGLEILEELLTDVYPSAFMVAEGDRWLTYPAALRIEGSRLRFLEPLPCHGNCRYLEIEGEGLAEYLTVYVGDLPRYRRSLAVRFCHGDQLMVHMISGHPDGTWWRVYT